MGPQTRPLPIPSRVHRAVPQPRAAETWRPSTRRRPPQADDSLGVEPERQSRVGASQQRLGRLGANPWDDESDDEASNSAGGGARLLMVPALVFFGVATLFGCLFRGIVGLRLRAVARQPDVSDGELCELKQANRINSVAVIASLVGLAAVGLAYVLL